MKLVKMSPENLEVANKYLELQDVRETARHLNLPLEQVTQILERKDIATYINSVYMDTGYRNRHKMAALMDEIIENKLAECRDTEMYSKKDLVDILKTFHAMKMDELKADKEVINQTNVQINNDSPFGTGNYAKLLEELSRRTTDNSSPVHSLVPDSSE